MLRPTAADKPETEDEELICQEKVKVSYRKVEATKLGSTRKPSDSSDSGEDGESSSEDGEDDEPPVRKPSSPKAHSGKAQDCVSRHWKLCVFAILGFALWQAWSGSRRVKKPGHVKKPAPRWTSSNASTFVSEPGQAPKTAAEAAVARLEQGPCFRGHQIGVLDFGAVGDGVIDDTQAVVKALHYAAGCENTVVIIGPADREFLVMPNGISVSLRSTTLEFQGVLLGPTLKTWNKGKDVEWPPGSCAFPDKAEEKSGRCGKSAQSPEYARSMYSLLHIRDSSNLVLVGGGGIRAPGSTFWHVRNHHPEIRGYCLLKIEGSKFIRVSGFKLWDSAMYHLVVMKSEDVVLSELNLQGKLASQIGEAHNTDGVNIIASSRVSLTNSVIASGDDHVVLKENTYSFKADNVTLLRGKGLAIGSLGERGLDEQVVKDVHFNNIVVFGSHFCARIKTWVGATGLVNDVRFTNFKCDKVEYGTYIDQQYCPSSQRPGGCSEEEKKQSIVLDKVTFENFSGTYKKASKLEHCSGCKGILYKDIFLTKR